MKKLKNKSRSYRILGFCLVFWVSCNVTEGNRTETFESFLHYYKANILKEEKLIIATEPIRGRKYDEIWYTLNIDSLKKKEFDSLNIDNWNQTYFPNASFLSPYDLKKMVYDIELQKKYHREGLGYYSISQPYISVDGKYVLIQTYYTCGDRCGYSKVQLFKFENSKWQLVKTYSEGIS